MAPRLNHRKSTRGCRRCKARKVKCNEQRPKCSHCSRHNLPCEYPALEPRVYTYPGTTTTTTTSTAQSQFQYLTPCPSPLKPPLQPPHLTPLPTTSLRLLHQYITHTAQTMGTAQIPSVRAMWEVSVPEMAFEYPPLLNTLLGVAAAHRAVLLPGEAEGVLRGVKERFMGVAVGGHRLDMARVLRGAGGDGDGGVSEMVCMNAIMISLYTLTLRREGDRDGSGGGGRGRGGYEPPLLWMNMARGIRTLIGRVYYRLVEKRARISPLLVARPVVHVNGNGNFSGGGGGDIYGDCRGVLGFLVDVNPDVSETEEIRAVYSECVRYLEGMLLAVKTGETGFDIRKRFSSFPSMMPGEFLRLLGEKRPRALVIVAYLFALVKGAEGVWWLKGIPEMEVRGIEGVVGEKWRGVMEWPGRVVRGEVDVGHLILGDRQCLGVDV
ncbi:hypothetical protein BO78DRAFT_442669 [Aspergillus sclerotiicarbonarius CBS 121057]|uniref:Zn(2)-C6 fungal-type domain-containing protein n=1 Tax=Aspergillus sclerotiicarbonarius (strain CBS 121057 / IBT 28362) TaxID=1448318 RepID=A0A319FJC9_ASPSB|nr:hypothetical protein BO78DRAFT_442669 [Aspergillus sclerotiicarbonarius CBS 121057]